jgi:hypothetical protein
MVVPARRLLRTGGLEQTPQRPANGGLLLYYRHYTQKPFRGRPRANLVLTPVYDNYRSHLLRDAEERAARTSSGSSVISDRQRVVLPSSTLLHHPPTLTMCF